MIFLKKWKIITMIFRVLKIGFLVGLLFWSGCIQQEIHEETFPEEKESSADKYPEQIIGLSGVELENSIEIKGFDTFYYTNVTCSEDAVYVSFQSKVDVYVIKYDTDFNHLKGPINLTRDIEKKYENENFPDHVFIYHEEFFYGVYHSSWAPGKYGLYVAKYDENLNIVSQAMVGYCEDKYGGENYELSDSPLIHVYSNHVYVLSSYHSDPSHKIGTIVRVYDTDLNFKEKFILDWSPFATLSAGDLILSEGNYNLITSEGKIPKIVIFEFNEEKNLIGRRELIPGDTSDPLCAVYQVAHPRAVLRKNVYYVPFIGAPGPIKTKEKDVIPVPNLYIGVFDESFSFQRLLKLTSYTEEDYKQICIVPAIYADTIGNYIYAAIGFTHLDENGKCSPWGTPTDTLFLVKYRITDSDDIIEGVKGPVIPKI